MLAGDARSRAGLVVGKPLGIVGAAWLAVRSGIADLPGDIGWRHVFGVAILGGIGFTVALFMTTVAFDDPALADQAKVGILAASLVAALLGSAVLRGASRLGGGDRQPGVDGPAATTSGCRVRPPRPMTSPVRLDDLIDTTTKVHDQPLDQLADAVLVGDTWAR